MEKINEFMHICIEELQLFYTKSDRGKKNPANCVFQNADVIRVSFSCIIFSVSDKLFCII